MIPENYNQQTTDLVNALEAITVLVDIAKRSPEIIVLVGLVLLFVGLFLI